MGEIVSNVISTLIIGLSIYSLSYIIANNDEFEIVELAGATIITIGILVIFNIKTVLLAIFNGVLNIFRK